MAEGTLNLFGDFGTEPGQISAAGVAAEVAKMGGVDVLNVQLSSRGGSVYEAMGVYKVLSDFAGRVVMNVALALSSATFVAMAGDEINMIENGLWMMHPPRMTTTGTDAELQNAADQLSKLRQSVNQTYAARSKLPLDQVEALVNAQTWMTAAQAKEKGFVDKVTPSRKVVAQVDLSPFGAVPDWAQKIVQTFGKERTMEPVMHGLKPGFNYSLDAEGKVIETPVAKVVTPAPGANAGASPEAGSPVMTAADIDKRIMEQVSAIVTAARERDKEITAVCMRAGVPEMAQKFIDDPKMTVGHVKDEMITVLCAKNVTAGVGGTDHSKGADPVAKYKAEFANSKSLMDAQGITEEAYVKSRQNQEQQRGQAIVI